MWSDPHRLLFVTGTRADFGKLKPLIEEVRRSAAFDYSLFVTGMHMLSRYGFTVNEIRRCGYSNIYTFINQDGAVNSQMDLVLGNTIHGLGHYVREFPPDMIIVHGDRIETLAGAIVGALNNVLVAHLEGGELSGTIDGLLRHAVSKMSHLHFVANEEARARLLQLGEAADTVFVIGSPDIDVMLSERLPSICEVAARYEIGFDNYIVALYHPVTSELARLPGNIDAFVNALEQSGQNIVAIYPNNDTGSDVILRALERLAVRANVRMIPSMRFEYFLTLLRHATAIVGNSSAGVREAPVYGVPTVNVGTRQLNRHRCESILDVPDDSSAILDALNALPSAVVPSLHFGRGDSAKRFVEALTQLELWNTPRQKQFYDLPWSADADQTPAVV
jgi:UDP-N-acetylglucosamine 2-epimerase (hydrolysing)